MSADAAKKWIEIPITGDAGLEITQDVNEAVRSQAVDLSKIHQKLYVWADRFGNLIGRQTGVDLLGIALSLEPGRKNRLGWYVIGRDGLQLRGRVTLNARYLDRPFCWLLEVLLHEQMHFAEELTGKNSKAKQSAYHTAWFRKHAAELGIPCDLKGRSTITQIDPKSQFGKLLQKHGVAIVPEPSLGEGGTESGNDGDNGPRGGGNRARGKSTLKKWVCTPGCTIIRTGRADIKAMCLVCRRKFERAD